MGGARKKSIRRMMKQQATKKSEKPERRERRSPRSVGGSVPDDSEVAKTIKELRAVTPYSLAGQLNVGVGVAKRILRSMEERGLVKLVCGSSRLRIYSSS